MSSDTDARLDRVLDELAQLRKRVEDVAHLAHASYHENLFWLRRISHGSATYLGNNIAMTSLINGCHCYVDTRSKDVGVHLLRSGTWEMGYTEAFKTLLRPGARVVDVGANLGWYSLIAAPIVGAEGRVYAVEPNPQLAQLVHWSLRTNGFLGFCKIFEVAVGDAPGVVDLVFNPDAPGGGHICPTQHEARGSGPAAIRVPSVPLDTLLAEEPAPIDVLKMDVEGWEGMAIRGLRATMDRSPKLRFLIEWSSQQDGSPAPRREMADTLQGRGYTPYRIHDDGKLQRTEWHALLDEPQLINLVLLPKGDTLVA